MDYFPEFIRPNNPRFAAQCFLISFPPIWAVNPSAVIQCWRVQSIKNSIGWSWKAPVTMIPNPKIYNILGSPEFWSKAFQIMIAVIPKTSKVPERRIMGIISFPQSCGMAGNICFCCKKEAPCRSSAIRTTTKPVPQQNKRSWRCDEWAVEGFARYWKSLSIP